jgi:outer membrane receptor protein involved in Fe transport
MDARYEEFNDPRVDLNPALAGLHDHVPFSPDFTARVALQHGFDLGDGGRFTVGGDVSHRGETWLSVDNRDGLKQDAYTLVGLYGVWGRTPAAAAAAALGIDLRLSLAVYCTSWTFYGTVTQAARSAGGCRRPSSARCCCTCSASAC